MRGENRVSAGGIVYRAEKEKAFFLLIGFKRRNIWCLPKGLIESGESELDAAQREVKEETGIARLNVIGKIGSINYRFWLKQRLISKTVHFYLFETDQVQTEVGEEHDMYSWFSYNEAVESLTYKNEREILVKAYDLIKAEIAKGFQSALYS
ncbi:NUDIX hydrolase [[Eubacterium] cellulosolvens]